MFLLLLLQQQTLWKVFDRVCERLSEEPDVVSSQLRAAARTLTPCCCGWGEALDLDEWSLFFLLNLLICDGESEGREKYEDAPVKRITARFQ